MFVLLQDPSLLQELLLLFLRHGDLAGLHGHGQAVVLQTGLEHVAWGKSDEDHIVHP